MKFNSEWLFNLYQEEAGTEENNAGGGGEEQPTEQKEETTTPDMKNEAPEWLQKKYLSEGRSQEESIIEQAKAYKELSSKFGSFTGAPEAYEVSLSDELKALGVELTENDPMMEAAQEFAKASNMNQDGFNQMINLYAMQQVAQNKAADELREAELKALGNNAQSRIENIQQWASKNLDSETLAGLEGFATNAGAVKAIEQLIKMTGAKSMDVDNTTPAPGIDETEVRKMQFELDENGNRRIQTDKAFKAKYEKARNELYGTHEHREMIG